MSKKIITAEAAKELVVKAAEKKYILSRDYEEVRKEELDTIFPAFDEFSMENWMKANCTDYATVTELPNEFFLEAATHKVTSLKGAFAGCAALTSIAQMDETKISSQFETRYVTDFTGMFDGCTSLPSILECVFQCDSITDVSQVAGMFTGSSVKTARLENLDLHVAASLITKPAQLGDLDAAIINGYYIKVVKTS